MLDLVAGIIPAYAGSTLLLCAASTGRGDHPRIRGEHVVDTLTGALDTGSSPHTRGAQFSRFLVDVLAGIIPAYAGSTSASPAAASGRGDHPRIRGEHQRVVYGDADAAGSSPHTRGARRDAGLLCALEGIIPAYAGSTRPEWMKNVFPQDHPRIRGEHHTALAERRLPLGSSPHTRGALTSNGELVRAFGIIPAYAGSTVAIAWAATLPPDHPRIRGEH